MQDIRLRAGTAALLSIAAFASITGAVVVLIWWLIFSRPARVIRKMRMVIPAIILIAFFGLVLELSGGGGFSYCLRMSVIILIGAWVYTGYHQGEFLRLGTWLFGKKTGFDLGMIAEMGLQSLELMVSDFSRIRQAQELKGIRFGLRSLVPAGSILIQGALRRADETAELMAVRGYTTGGSYCPVFETPVKDIIAGIAALCMGIIAFVPVSEFFILYH
ncbi:MAG: energy-coupling factor transporter transmembrane component T [Methanoregula sp.]|jgi:energy-coupling factor transport system permease protein